MVFIHGVLFCSRFRMKCGQDVLQCYCILTTILLLTGCHGYDWTSINLPAEHVAYFFKNNPDVKDLCASDKQCPYKVGV